MANWLISWFLFLLMSTRTLPVSLSVPCDDMTEDHYAPHSKVITKKNFNALFQVRIGQNVLELWLGHIGFFPTHLALFHGHGLATWCAFLIDAGQEVLRDPQGILEEGVV